jgi:hypothetical protein
MYDLNKNKMSRLTKKEKVAKATAEGFLSKMNGLMPIVNAISLTSCFPLLKVANKRLELSIGEDGRDPYLKAVVSLAEDLPTQQDFNQLEINLVAQAIGQKILLEKGSL